MILTKISFAWAFLTMAFRTTIGDMLSRREGWCLSIRRHFAIRDAFRAVAIGVTSV